MSTQFGQWGVPLHGVEKASVGWMHPVVGLAGSAWPEHSQAGAHKLLKIVHMSPKATRSHIPWNQPPNLQRFI